MVCSLSCAFEYSKKKTEKKKDNERKEVRRRLRKQKEELKTLSELKRELQVLFNRYIRLSKKMACVSCGKDLSQEKFDAGHYLSTQAHPELRFEEDNVWPQCVKCNRDLHGNLIEYRKGLVRLKGEEFVLNLEKKHEPKNYTKDDIRELIKRYKEKIKNLSS